MSDPLTSRSGTPPHAYPLPAGTLGLSSHLLSLSSKAPVTLLGGIWTEIGFTGYCLLPGVGRYISDIPLQR